MLRCSVSSCSLPKARKIFSVESQLDLIILKGLFQLQVFYASVLVDIYCLLKPKGHIIFEKNRNTVKEN